MMSDSQFDFDDFQFDDVQDKHKPERAYKSEEEEEEHPMNGTYTYENNDDSVNYSEDFSDDDEPTDSTDPSNTSRSTQRNYTTSSQGSSRSRSNHNNTYSRQSSNNSKINSSRNRKGSDSISPRKESNYRNPVSKNQTQNGFLPKKRGSGASGKGRGRGRGRGAEKSKPPPVNRTQVVDRVLSANRHKSQALHNTIFELQQQVDTLSIENRDLKRTARLQDRELRKLDSTEAELPALLKKHSTEMRVLQERYKKQKELSDNAKETLKRRDEELAKVRDKLKKYEELAKENNLFERSNMNKKIENLEKEIEEKDKKIVELTRASQLNEKSRNRELKEKNDRFRRALEEIKRLENEHRELQRRLKDKEKALEVTNIYSQRISQRRGSKESQQLFSETDPVPSIIKRLQEEQEAESIRKAFLTDRNTVRGSDTSEVSQGKMFTHDFEGERLASGKRKKKFKGESVEATPTETPHKNEPIKTLVSETNNKDIDLESDGFYDDAKQEDITEEKQKLEEIDRKLAELKQREEEQQETRRRKQAEKDLEERLRKMEKERLEKEKELRKKELEELENNRRLEEALQQRNNERDKQLEIEREKHKEEMLLLKEKQEKENVQRKLGNEGKQTVDDEKRRKKELLIARMKAIDRGEDPDEVNEPPPKNPVNNQPNQVKPRKKKPIFLASSNAETHKSDDENFLNHDPLDFSKPSKPHQNGDQNSSNFLFHDPLDFNKPKAVSRRNTDDSVKSTKSDRRNSWEFKQTDENLHRGLPSQTGINDSPTLSRRNTKDSDIIKHNSASSSGRHGRRHSGINSGDKKDREATLTDEGLKTEYTPSSSNDSPGPLASKPVKKNNYNLAFAEFEDPFGLGKPKTNKLKPTNTLVFSSDEDELDSPGYQPSKSTVKKPMIYNQNNSVRLRSPGVVEDDDLEETILA